VRMPYIAAPAIAGMVALMAGCGQSGASTQGAADTSRTGSSPAATSSASPPSAVPQPITGAGPIRCGPLPAGSTAGKSLVLGNSNEGRSYCVGVGTEVLIFLRGTPAIRWAPIHASSDVLQPRANGRLMLALGVTGASFVAVRPGTAMITSYRPACAGSVPTGSGVSSMSGASQPTMMCDALLGFRVTVIVR
jgi:hypothetical protein